MGRGDDPLHVWQLPDGRWRGQVTDGYLPSGKPRRRYVHGPTEKAARSRKKKLMQSIAKGEAIAGRTTVKAWADVWLPVQLRQRRPKTYLDYRTAVTRWIVPTIGDRRLSDLTPADVRAVGEAVRKAGGSSTSAGLRQTILRKLLKDAVSEGHQVPARVLAVSKPAKAAHDRTALPLNDALAVLKVAAGDPDGSQWAAAFLQGMRQGERLGLSWSAVDLDAGTLDVSWQLQALSYTDGPGSPLRVPDGYEYRQLHGALCLVRPKSAAGFRVIPLVPWLAAALQSWQDRAPTSPHGLVWPRPDGRPMDATTDRAAWHSLQDRADVRHPSGRYWLGHEIRHTTATLLMTLGVDESVRTAILGHSSVTTTRGYQHADKTHVRAALEAMSLRLGLTA